MAVLETLVTAPDEVEKLDTIPYLELVIAGNEAIAKISGPRRPGSQGMFGFAPSADGDILVQQPFSPTFADFSNDIPILMGSTLNEMMPVFYGENDLT